jgi:hypothetical protein
LFSLDERISVSQVLLRLLALGPRKYWASGWNRFDLLVTVINTVGLFLKFKV